MSTEGPMNPENDRRDERLAELLDVPPLDDVTRRRLVRRALEESGAPAGRGYRRFVAIAAAAAVGVIALFGVAVVLRDDGTETNTAGQDRTTEKTAQPPAAGDADEEQAAPAAGPIYVGDVGEVSDPAVLRERLEQRAAEPVPPADSESATEFACTFTSDGAPTLFATGTYDGTPVSVFVAPKGGVDTAFVVDEANCQVLSEVPLV